MAKLRLHEAMVVVMVRNGRFTMPATELVEAINQDRLFLRKDRKPLPAQQVLARARRKKYRNLFRVRGAAGSKAVSLRLPKKAREVQPEPVA